MIAIARFELPLSEADAFRSELESVRDVLSAAEGFVSGTVGQNLDEPTLWVLTTEWKNVG
ncbi:MAG: antibiotic biosynthesis monooxygenase, partial [Actinobacteria bacterium]|nr:antibiotic biosynthesis monooxygenase [Actinomycetota bacterium]